jgi:hypothetical protein
MAHEDLQTLGTAPSTDSAPTTRRRAPARIALVVFLLAAPARMASAQAAPAFPDWAGTWDGQLVNIPAAPGATPVQVTAEIGAFPTADKTCSTLRNTYRERGEVKGVKDYRLCRGDGPDDLYVDEGGGLKLAARLLGDSLVTAFKYGATILVSTMTLRDGVLVEEILSVGDKPATDGPLPLGPVRIQRLTLRRAAHAVRMP